MGPLYACGEGDSSCVQATPLLWACHQAVMPQCLTCTLQGCMFFLCQLTAGLKQSSRDEVARNGFVIIVNTECVSAFR